MIAMCVDEVFFLEGKNGVDFKSCQKWCRFQKLSKDKHLYVEDVEGF